MKARAAHGRALVWLDRLTLLGIAAGIAIMLQPWWAPGFRAGFFVTLSATIAQIVTSHTRPRGAR